ncbi:MAG: periplasmic heavy metal sensor [Acidobacteria bacterium]|nr:periplasmic heavy metal sensor [Acidobacteriota bacterium]
MTFRKSVLAALLTLFCSGYLLAQVDIPAGKWWRKNPELIQALNLTSQQVSKIEIVFERYREPLLGLQLDFKKKSLDLQRMLEAEALDEQRIESQIGMVEQARSELAKQRLLMIVKIRRLLKPGQWRILREKYAEQRRLVRPPQGIRSGAHGVRSPSDRRQ